MCSHTRGVIRQTSPASPTTRRIPHTGGVIPGSRRSPGRSRRASTRLGVIRTRSTVSSVSSCAPMSVGVILLESGERRHCGAHRARGASASWAYLDLLRAPRKGGSAHARAGRDRVPERISYFSHFRTAANFQREPGPVKGREAIRAADAEGALDRTGLPRIIKRPEMGASHQTNNPHTKQTRRSLQAGHSRNRSESTVCREPGTMPSCRTIPVGLSKATLSPRTPPDQLAGTPPSLGVATPIPLSRPGPG